MNKTIKIEAGVYLINSGLPGPTLSVLGGIHGDEVCGLELLDNARNNLSITSGKIYLIYGNLSAIKMNTRQCDVNLNRIFKAPEKLSQQEKNAREYNDMIRVKKYLELSDACLDIHSSPTPDSPAFAICEANSFDAVSEFPVDYVCAGFSNVEPGGTDYFMYKKNKIGICIECGSHLSPQALNIAQYSLRCFLKYFGMQEGENKKKNKIYLQATRAYLTKTNKYVSAQKFTDFKMTNKGEILGYDGDTPIYAQENGCILFARDRNISGVEAFVELINL